MGLSAFAQTIALNAANLENRVTAYFSMSTAQDKFVSEMICGEARVDVNRFPTGYLTRYEWGRIGDAVKTLEESTIFLEDKYDISVDEIQTKLKTLLVQQGKLDLVIVDNLQYLSASQKTRAKNYEPSQILYELKGIAKELNIPIIVICQLPASEGNYLGYPNHIDLNKAGIFEQFADISIMIHREEVYKPTIENQGIAKITVSNLHNGLTRTFDLVFLKEFNRFENYVSNYEEVKNDD
jgi:replicative DNA helicase